MAYGLGAGSSIGSLLRFIQEQKSQGPIVPPGTETGSPVRAMVQEPLKAPESVDTAHVVSIKPEGVPSVSGGETQSAVTPASAPTPVSPVSATPMTPPSMGSSPVAEPVGEMGKPSVTPSSGPSLGTSIKPPVPQVNKVFTAGGQNITPEAKGVMAYGPNSNPEYFQPFESQGPSPERSAGMSRAVGQMGGAPVLEPKSPPNPLPTVTGTQQQYKQIQQAYPTPTPAPKAPTPAPYVAPKIYPNIITQSTGMQSVRKVKQYDPKTGTYYYINA
jgi:hypothetical protein